MPDPTSSQAPPASPSELLARISTLEDRVMALETAGAERLASLEKAFASFAAPALGVVEHDSHAAAIGFMDKVKHLFAKPAGVPPGAEAKAADPVP